MRLACFRPSSRSLSAHSPVLGPPGRSSLLFHPPASRVCMASKSNKYPGPFEDVGASLLKAPKLILSDAERQRLDDSPDAAFYSTPRMMQHADDDFIEALTSIYSSILSPSACILELCASRYSHLPDGFVQRLVVGQGMNSSELAANPSLHQHFVQDLNLQPLLLKELDASYDVVLCVNGIQYLTQPETVLCEASRVLRPGGMLVVVFGPHCFREKALAGWLSRDTAQRSTLLQEIIQANGFDKPVVLDSPAAAAELAQSRQASQATAGAVATQAQAATQSGSPGTAHNGNTTAVTQGSSVVPSSSSRGSTQAGAQIQVLVAWKSRDWTAGAAELDTATGVDMRPDNVEAWFTKPGLAGLLEAASAHSSQPHQQQHHTDLTVQPATSPTAGSSGGAAAAAAVNEKLLQQWHAAYQSLTVDAADLGIPRSVIPAVPADASPAQLQEAVQHLQAMMASFLSAGL